MNSPVAGLARSFMESERLSAGSPLRRRSFRTPETTPSTSLLTDCRIELKRPIFGPEKYLMNNCVFTFPRFIPREAPLMGDLWELAGLRRSRLRYAEAPGVKAKQPFRLR